MPESAPPPPGEGNAAANPFSRLYRPDGSTLVWRSDGPTDAPALILSNSLATDHLMWDPVVQALASRHRVLRYDTRGHGASTSASGKARLEDLSDDLVAVLDAAGVGRATIVGISLGGMTAMMTGLRHPSRVAALLACHCRARIDAAQIGAWQQRVALARAQGIEALVEPTLERWFATPVRESSPALMDRVRAMIGRTSLQGYEACVHAICGLDLHGALGGLGMPVGFVAGAQDGAAPPAEMQAMSEQVPGSRFTVIDPCGHLSSLDRPERLLEAIEALDQRVAPGAGT
ncbi:MAG: alpha/beta fold hydrolase [Lautropia sp.]